MTDRIDPELKKILTRLLLQNHITEGKPPTVRDLFAMAEHEREHLRSTPPESVAITSAVLSKAEIEAILSALYAMRVELLREQRRCPDGNYRELLETNDSAIRKLSGMRLPQEGHISFED